MDLPRLAAAPAAATRAFLGALLAALQAASCCHFFTNGRFQLHTVSCTKGSLLSQSDLSDLTEHRYRGAQLQARREATHNRKNALCPPTRQGVVTPAVQRPARHSAAQHAPRAALSRARRAPRAAAMLEARLIQGGLLKRTVDAIKDLVGEGNFECSAAGIQLQAMDTSHVCLVTLMLRADGFERYRCGGRRAARGGRRGGGLRTRRRLRGCGVAAAGGRAAACGRPRVATSCGVAPPRAPGARPPAPRRQLRGATSCGAGPRRPARPPPRDHAPPAPLFELLLLFAANRRCDRDCTLGISIPALAKVLKCAGGRGGSRRPEFRTRPC